MTSASNVVWKPESAATARIRAPTPSAMPPAVTAERKRTLASRRDDRA